MANTLVVHGGPNDFHFADGGLAAGLNEAVDITRVHASDTPERVQLREVTANLSRIQQELHSARVIDAVEAEEYEQWKRDKAAAAKKVSK